jgi:hypothetical protein
MNSAPNGWPGRAGWRDRAQHALTDPAQVARSVVALCHAWTAQPIQPRSAALSPALRHGKEHSASSLLA